MSEQVILTAGAIIDAQDKQVECVDVPEWGGCVYVRVLSGGERDAWEGECRRVKGGIPPDPRSKWAALVLCDPDGKRLFTDKQIDELRKKSSKALERILVAGQRLNGIGDDDIEELEKNSGSGQSDDSGSTCL